MKIIDVNSWNEILNRMIIIGGCARSGTTIMGKLINSLKNTEYYFEPPMLTSLLLKENELEISSIHELLQFYFYDNFLLDCLAGRNLNLNLNDDSCILHVKSLKEISQRQEKTFGRVELENIVQESTFSFKLPEIVFFLSFMNKLYFENKTILMHRNPNDVINSMINKKWFSSDSLNKEYPSQVFAIKITNSIKVPYWINPKDETFWVEATEIDRCAYYYKRVSEEIINHSTNAIIIDYDKFINKPEKIFKNISEKLNLEMTEKTYDILKTVKYQDKKRKNHLSSIERNLKEEILKLDSILKGCCLK